LSRQTTRRLGVSAVLSRRDMLRKSALLGAMRVDQGNSNGLLCVTFVYYDLHLYFIRRVIDKRQGVSDCYAMSGVILQDRTLFIAGPYIHEYPTAAQIAEMTVLAAQCLRGFGVEPRVALLSHSDFRASQRTSAVKTREA
ncbi:NADP-dependent malic enzyme, partial [Moraxella catarrhalis]|uniref:phosphate acyltransferase n=1 Tax=Moraxella catarrhalis TaxID=480 RepID=UPI002228809E